MDWHTKWEEETFQRLKRYVFFNFFSAYKTEKKGIKPLSYIAADKFTFLYLHLCLL